MDVAAILRRARLDARLSLRALADRAGTSHSTLAAYEAGRKTPSFATMERLLRAAGFELTLAVQRMGDDHDPQARGRELADVLLLAEQFPARHDQRLDAPIFGRP